MEKPPPAEDWTAGACRPRAGSARTHLAGAGRAGPLDRAADLWFVERAAGDCARSGSGTPAAADASGRPGFRGHGAGAGRYAVGADPGLDATPGGARSPRCIADAGRAASATRTFPAAHGAATQSA